MTLSPPCVFAFEGTPTGDVIAHIADATYPSTADTACGQKHMRAVTFHASYLGWRGVVPHLEMSRVTKCPACWAKAGAK